jgi:hypothetical protein
MSKYASAQTRVISRECRRNTPSSSRGRGCWEQRKNDITLPSTDCSFGKWLTKVLPSAPNWRLSVEREQRSRTERCAAACNHVLARCRDGLSLISTAHRRSRISGRLRAQTLRMSAESTNVARIRTQYLKSAGLRLREVGAKLVCPFQRRKQ